MYLAKVVVFRQTGCVRAKLLYSGKVLVSGQKWLYFVKSGWVRAKWLYPGKSVCIRAKGVVFGQKSCDHTNVVVFGLKW